MTPADEARKKSSAARAEWRRLNPEKDRATSHRMMAKYKAAFGVSRKPNPGHAEYQREWRKNNPEKVKASNWKRREALRQFINGLKSASGCVDCGYNAHPAALEYDHVRGQKVRNVGNMYSMKAVLIEIEKCEVRCANCHAIRHYYAQPHRQKDNTKS